ncbi:uncharacterized protein A4U43_C02F5230 [Asparagus officinalis]|uniref:Uncharacterized protein n=1 Tax=Asparagus officinalis TaxID=4686 RepID=A0A5P1FKV0_ASPOF|nr:uncharacterized protein A4U43_C02F5230 [Asparagus officinalis]
MALHVARNLLEAIKAPSSSTQTPEPLAIPNILLEAIKLPFKKYFNLVLVLLLILLSTLTSFFLRSYPFPTVSIDPNSELDILLAALLEYMLFTYVIPTALFILSCIILIMIVHSLSNNPSIIFMGLKRPLTTTLFATAFYQGFSSLVRSVPSTLMLMAGPDPIIPEVPDAVLALLEGGYLKCFDMIFAVSLMISMAPEDGCFGLEAIYKAMEVVAGRKWEVAMLVLVEVLTINMLSEISDVAGLLGAFEVGGERYVPALVQKAVYAVVGVFEIAVSVVLYFECKSRNVNNGEDGIIIRIVDGDGLVYESVPDVAPLIP